MEKVKKTKTPPDIKGKRKKRKGVIRENIESILIAVALALVMRFFVVEAFKIPTGSMAPTLLGAHKDVICPNCEWRFSHNGNGGGLNAFCPNCLYKIKTHDLGNHSGNRILVNKVFYKFTKPKPDRWDIIVFKYPRYDVTCRSCSFTIADVEWRENMKCPRCGSTKLRKKQKNYIKRLVGLPGETLQVINGDLYINGHIERKPPKVQEALWVPVYNSNYLPKRKVFTSWVGGDGHWEMSDTSVRFNSEEDDSTLSFVTFGKAIENHSGYNSGTGEVAVGDLMIRCDVQMDKDAGGIAVMLEEDGEQYMAFIRSENGAQESYLENDGTALVTDSNAYLEPGKVHKIEFSNVDDMLTLRLDGQVVFSHDNAGEAPVRATHNHQSGIKLGCAGSPTTFSNIEIFADVYYTDSPHTWGVDEPLTLADDEYFFLGDNSSSSNDSRVWKSVPEDNLVGKAFFTFWPLRTIKFIK